MTGAHHADPVPLEERRRGPGRPPLGDATKAVGSFRLEPALRDHAARQAEEEGISVSELIRRALRQYLTRPLPQGSPRALGGGAKGGSR